MASSTDNTIAVRRSSGKVEELSAEELEQLNYERKVRDQESTGRLITPKQVNIFAVALCIAVLFYALPKIFFGDNEEPSTYIPLSERDEDAAYDDFVTANRITRSVTEQVMSQLPEQPQQGTSSNAQNVATPIQQSSAEVLALMKEQQEVILRSEVLDDIQQWATDWSAQDVEAYLSHYSEKFISDKGMGLDEWKAYRSSRVAKPDWVQVMLLDVDIEILSDSRVNAQFTQNYSASNYQDLSSKILSLENTDDGWKILAEVSLN